MPAAEWQSHHSRELCPEKAVGRDGARWAGRPRLHPAVVAPARTPSGSVSMKCPEEANPQAESRRVVPRGLGTGGSDSRWARGLFLGRDENVLELGDGDGPRTV